MFTVFRCCAYVGILVSTFFVFVLVFCLASLVFWRVGTDELVTTVCMLNSIDSAVLALLPVTDISGPFK